MSDGPDLDLGPVALVGYGRFGRALGERLEEVGVALRAFDPHVVPPAAVAAGGIPDLLAGAEVVVLAVPVATTGAALAALRPHLGPDQLVMDVGSVKVGPVTEMEASLGSDIPWIGTHPLFGPTSLALGERPLCAVVCPNALHPSAPERARALYRRVGCDELVELDPQTHDRRMAESHALGYFVAKGFLDAGIRLEGPLLAPSSRAIARTVEAVQEDAAHLFASLHRENPFAGEARRRLLDALTAVDEALRGPVPATDEPHHEGGVLHIEDLGEVSPRIADLRQVIDGIDRELVELLVRRAELATRAAHAKAALGRGIQDPRREAELLADRRGQADRLGLDGGAVEDVFRAILRFSRGHQERGGGKG